MVPYAFCNTNSPKVVFDHPSQWWGEKPEGIKQTIELAKANGLKVMLKPHLWVRGKGWAGELDFDNPKELKIWQKSVLPFSFSLLGVTNV